MRPEHAVSQQKDHSMSSSTIFTKGLGMRRTVVQDERRPVVIGATTPDARPIL
jgi:hypothetical protein